MNPLVRCLYCKKELPLLKRLSGAEFCSDAHRQQYKAEYNELAFNRLVQAKPVVEPPRSAPNANALQTPVVPEPLGETSTPAKTGSAPQVVSTPPAYSSKPAPPKPVPSKAAVERRQPTGGAAPGRAPIPGVHGQGVTRPVATRSNSRQYPPGAPKQMPAASVTARKAPGTTNEPPQKGSNTSVPAAPAGPASTTSVITPASLPGQDKTTADITLAPQRLVAQAPPEEQPIVAGDIPFQKPNPVKKIFTAVASASFDFSPSPILLRLNLAGPAHALLPEASPFPVTIVPSDADSTPRSREAWMESKDFHHGTPTPETPESRISDFLVERRTEPLPSVTLPCIVPDVAAPRLAGAANFSESLAEQDSLLSAELRVLSETLIRTNVPDEQTIEGQTIPLGGAVECQPSVYVHSQLASSVVIDTGALEPLASVSATDPRIIRPIFDSAAAPQVQAPTPVVAPMTVDLPAIPSGEAQTAEPYDVPLVPDAAVNLWNHESLPLRPRMWIGTLSEPDFGKSEAENQEALENEWSKRADSGVGVSGFSVPAAEPNGPEVAVALESATEPKSDQTHSNTETTVALADAPPAVTELAPIRAIPVIATEQPKIVAAPSPAPTVVVESAQSAATPIREQVQRNAVLAPTPTVQEPPQLDEFDLLRSDLSKKQASRGSTALKIGGAIVGVLALAGALLFFLHNDSGKKEIARVATSNPGSEKDWILNFSPDAANPRNVAVLRSSSGLQNYRVEFDGMADIGGLGWVFRAKDPRNFYVTKIERPKPGSGVSLLVSHYAVVDGGAQSQIQKPVVGITAPDGVYHVRSEAVGDHFRTWVQGTQVDEWKDARIANGGAGLYSESGEHAMLVGEFRVIPFSQGK